jgi:hypothetical protein
MNHISEIKHDGQALVAIADTTRGRALVATKDLDPGILGLTVLEEEALIVSPPPGSAKDEAPPKPSDVPNTSAFPSLWSQYWCYRKQPEEIRSKILGFYVEMYCKDAIVIRHVMTPFAKREGLDVEEFVRVNMAFKFNAVSVHPPSEDGEGSGTFYGSGLFELACRMSHSCKPNCFWFTRQDGTKRFVRLLSPVKKGEELTINYKKGLMLPFDARRESLLKERNFVCTCVRCTEPKYDDTRCFSCSDKKCAGCHFVALHHGGNSNDQASFTDCTVCQASVTAHKSQQLLRAEEKLRTEVERIEDIINNQMPIDVSLETKRLRPLHPHHWLTELITKAQGELYTQLGEYRLAAEANQKRVKCREAILGDTYNNRNMAFAHERLGDSLVRFNLVGAEQAYQRTVRMLQITDGASTPYSQAAIQKLLSMQNRLSKSRPKAFGMTDTTLCALCGAPAQSKCGQCNRAVYCCRDHQRSHWRTVHKFCCTK